LKFQKIYLESIFLNDIFRNKISVLSKINKKFDSYISAEIFYCLYELNRYIFDEYGISLGPNIDLPNKKK